MVRSALGAHLEEYGYYIDGTNQSKMDGFETWLTEVEGFDYSKRFDSTNRMDWLVFKSDILEHCRASEGIREYFDIEGRSFCVGELGLSLEMGIDEYIVEWLEDVEARLDMFESSFVVSFNKKLEERLNGSAS